MLAPWKKSYGKPRQCIKKQRYHFANKDLYSQSYGWKASPTQWTWVWASSGNWWWTGKPGMLQFMGSQRLEHNWATELMVFPVVMYGGFESWTIKKAEYRTFDAFKLWCWRRLLRVSWTARRSNQSILKEINPEYLLEGLMLKLRLQYFGYLMGRANSLEKTWYWERLRAGGEGGDRGRDGWMASPTRWTWVWANSGRWWRTGKPGVLQFTGSQRVRYDLTTEQQQH